ncbi:tRNA lysidine(34) synthetase TilS [Legionella sp. CNM-4043-24]|uniref:tRNA lysidine(34) synthetase TilS n=1 Tax=Legionella sp. CNM-4043-24 TaxID=3421646 RepID=UPI00403AC5F3
MSDLLSPDWLPRLSAASRLILAYSGGLDSTVLLHCMAQQKEWRDKMVAVHVNHGLNPRASAWEAHCQEQCRLLGISFIAKQVAIDSSSNLEEQARKARYTVFHSLLKAGDLLLLAHHQDDQAETLLLQLFRGAGVEGLGAMRALRQMGAAEAGRPLLQRSRSELAAWAIRHQLTWIEDDSNDNQAFSRNFLRHEVLPLLQTRWPAISARLARTAAHCQQAQDLLEEGVAQTDIDLSLPTLSLSCLDALTVAQRIHVLRAWLKHHTQTLPNTKTLDRLLYELIPARDDAMPEVSFAESVVRRHRHTLYLLPYERAPSTGSQRWAWTSFPEPLQLKHTLLTARSSRQGLGIPEGASLEIRFRQGGESFRWHGQNKSLKKLLQEWDIPTWLRSRIPLLFIDGQLAAVIGYAVSDSFYKSDSPAWAIVEGINEKASSPD